MLTKALRAVNQGQQFVDPELNQNQQIATSDPILSEETEVEACRQRYEQQRSRSEAVHHQPHAITCNQSRKLNVRSRRLLQLPV